MASNTWENILLASRAGREIGQGLAGIGEGIYRGLNQGMSPQEQIERRLQLENQANAVRNNLILKAAIGEAPGIVRLKPGQPSEGIEDIGVEGMGLDRALRRKELQEANQMAVEKAAAIYGARPTRMQMLKDANGNVYWGNPITGDITSSTDATGTQPAQPRNNQTFELTQGATPRDIPFPDGKVHRVLMNKAGQIVQDFGEAPIGVQAVIDPLTGIASAIPRTVTAGQPVTAIPVNAPGSSQQQPSQPQQQPKPFKMGVPDRTPAPMKEKKAMYEAVKKDVQILKAKLEEIKRSGVEPGIIDNAIAAETARTPSGAISSIWQQSLKKRQSDISKELEAASAPVTASLGRAIAGTALTDTEKQNLVPFAPTRGENVDDIIKKVNGLEPFIENQLSAMSGQSSNDQYAQSAYGSAEGVRAAFKAGKLTREQAKEELRKLGH